MPGNRRHRTHVRGSSLAKSVAVWHSLVMRRSRWRAIAAALVAFALVISLLSAGGGIAGWEFVALTITLLVVVAVRVRRDSARLANRAGL